MESARFGLGIVRLLDLENSKFEIFLVLDILNAHNFQFQISKSTRSEVS